MKEAHSCGADLNYQDESGRTVLHKMFQEAASDWLHVRNKETYALFCSTCSPRIKSSGLVWTETVTRLLITFEVILKALEIFVTAGATTKSGSIFKDHECPWVAVPWISVEISMQLTGEKHFTNIDARDSL